MWCFSFGRHKRTQIGKAKISVITVVFNNEDTIADTIESVAAQDYANLEYIVIDGLSKDRTLDRIKERKEIIQQAYLRKGRRNL